MASTSPTFNAEAAAPSAHVFRHLRPDHPDRRPDRRPDPGRDRSQDRGRGRGLERAPPVRVSARWAASAVSVAAARGSMGTLVPGLAGTLVRGSVEMSALEWVGSSDRGLAGTSALGKELPVGTLVPVLIADTYWCYGDTLYFPAKKLLIASLEVCVLVM